MPVEPESPGADGVFSQSRLDELLSELQAYLQAAPAMRDRTRGLLEAVVAIASGLSPETTLRRISEAAVILRRPGRGTTGISREPAVDLEVCWSVVAGQAADRAFAVGLGGQ